MDQERVGFTFIPAHQDGTTFPHLPSTVGLGISSTGGAVGPPSMRGAGTTLRVLCGNLSGLTTMSLISGE